MADPPLTSGEALTLPSTQTRLPLPAPSLPSAFHQGSSHVSWSNLLLIRFSIISYFEQIMYMKSKLIFPHISHSAFCCFYILTLFSSSNGTAQHLGSVPASYRLPRAPTFTARTRSRKCWRTKKLLSFCRSACIQKRAYLSLRARLGKYIIHKMLLLHELYGNLTLECSKALC